MSQSSDQKINCYPSLDSHAGAITDPTDVVPAILKQLIYTPGMTSNVYENTTTPYKLSVWSMIANFGNDPKVLCRNFADNLLTVYKRYFPNRFIIVSCDYELYPDNVRYDLIIDIQEKITNGTFMPLLVSQKVSINPKTNEIKIKYGDNNE